MDNIEKLIEYGKRAHADGLVIGSGGNISIRDGGALFIKKRFADMSDAGPDDYVRVPLAGLDEEPATSASSEVPLHKACYAAEKDIESVVHVHSPYMIAVAGKTDKLESVSYEFDCVLEKAVPVLDFIRPGSFDLGEAVGGSIAEGARAVLMRRHGAVSVGKDLDEAYLRILALERACITFLHS